MDLAFQLWKPSHENPNLETKRIVLLHGMGGTGKLWRPIAASLENDFQVLAPDQRGHGQSRIVPVPGGREMPSYSPLDYGRDVVDTLEHNDFYPTWLVGHSMGVRSAVAAAHLHPAGIQGLILVDLGFANGAAAGYGESLASFLKEMPAEFPSRDAARAYMATRCPDPAIGQYLMAVSTPTGTGGLSFPFDHKALIETIHSARDFSIGPWVTELATLGKPILILRGATSIAWTHEEFEAARRTYAPYPRVVFEEVPGTGHGLPFEKRIEFVARVRSFVSQT